MSSFFRDELLVQVHILSLWIEEKKAWREEGCTMTEARRLAYLKYSTWILEISWSWTLMSILMNHPFHKGHICILLILL